LRNIKLKKQFTVAERETFFSYLGGQEKGVHGGDLLGGIAIVLNMKQKVTSKF